MPLIRRSRQKPPAIFLPRGFDQHAGAGSGKKQAVFDASGVLVTVGDWRFGPAEMGDSVELAATLEALSQRLRGPLRRFFEKRLGSRNGEIEDLVQEVFLRLAASPEIRPGERLEGYVFRTAVNLLHDYHRRRGRRAAAAHEPYDEVLHGNPPDQATPERELLGEEAVERLVAALHGLTERTRSVWVLYHFEDLPHAEIARQLGMAQSTVEKHMRRANAHLLKYIARFV